MAYKTILTVLTAAADAALAIGSAAGWHARRMPIWIFWCWG